jgi:hypothetical protein
MLAEDQDDPQIEPPEGIEDPNELFADIREEEELVGTGLPTKPKVKPITKRKGKQRTVDPDGQSPEKSTYLQELGHNRGFTVNVDSVDPEGFAYHSNSYLRIIHQQ